MACIEGAIVSHGFWFAVLWDLFGVFCQQLHRILSSFLATTTPFVLLALMAAD
jgi:hypothetical protein